MHYLLTEAIELGSMQGFCYVISNHLVCQTIFDVNVAFGLLIGDIEVSDVQMTRVLACTDMIYTKTAIVPCYCSNDRLNTRS